MACELIEVVEYNPLWPEMYEQEKRLIIEALGDNFVDIYHVGSTSVPGLAAKPRIDIIAVANDRDRAIVSLENAGYLHKGEWNIPLKCGFTKREDVEVNLHLFFDENHPEIELNLLFRDALRNDDRLRDAYADIKFKILEDPEAHKREEMLSIPVYTVRKREFIDNVIKDLGFNRLRILKCLTEKERDFAMKIREMSNCQTALETADYEHFILYRGTTIIGYAGIKLKPEINVEVLSVINCENFAGEDKWFEKNINKWRITKKQPPP